MNRQQTELSFELISSAMADLNRRILITRHRIMSNNNQLRDIDQHEALMRAQRRSNDAAVKIARHYARRRILDEIYKLLGELKMLESEYLTLEDLKMPTRPYEMSSVKHIIQLAPEFGR